MNQSAQTLLHQANDAIEAGAVTQAMELLRQARLLAGADRDMSSRILTQMIHIAAACNCESEAVTWRKQLAQLGARRSRSIVDSTRAKKAAPGRVQNLRIVMIVVGFIAAFAILAFAVPWFWRYSAARFRPDPAPPATATSATSQPG